MMATKIRYPLSPSLHVVERVGIAERCVKNLRPFAQRRRGPTWLRRLGVVRHQWPRRRGRRPSSAEPSRRTEAQAKATKAGSRPNLQLAAPTKILPSSGQLKNAVQEIFRPKKVPARR